MSEFSDRITEVLEPHQLYHEYRPLNPCAWFCRGCDFHGENYRDACAHVAEAVEAAIPFDLRVEKSVITADDAPYELQRLVSPWVVVACTDNQPQESSDG